MSVPPKPDPIKHCATCGVLMTRKRFNGRLEDYGVFLRRAHCSLSCGNTKAQPTSVDAYHWRARQHRGPACEACGGTDDLHVHHKDRDRTNNDLSNLQTLCGSCHLKLHWNEDRDRRMASRPRVERPDEKCVVCGRPFKVGKETTKRQTCGERSCWNRLLSLRAMERYSGGLPA